MTAEVVVMNREAVALAADSAVTIGDGQKIFNTANKVFMLAPGLPVGLLIYNNPNFMEVPWEIIIKSYRTKLIEEKISFPTLEEYANDFFAVLEKNGNFFVKRDQQEGIFRATIHSVLDNITKDIWDRINKVFYERASLDEKEVDNIVESIILEHHNKWSSYQDIFPKSKNASLKKSVLAQFKTILTKEIERLFDKLPLTPKRKKLLREIAIFQFSKKRWLSYYSGIVFAGYGNKDLFPSCVEYRVESFFNKTLIFALNQKAQVGFKDEEVMAAIMPFAQDDVMQSILSGRHPVFEAELMNRLKEKLSKNDLDTIMDNVQKTVWRKLTAPIINTITVLPKDELASVAQTLVNLTSFMRRVSMDIETVGGPVDVAVISKKDGFIWIDRKHYFTPDKNLHFNPRGDYHVKNKENNKS